MLGGAGNGLGQGEREFALGGIATPSEWVANSIEERTMTCSSCQGRMTRTSAPLHLDRKGYRLALDAVPVWICWQCGESHYEEREVAAIQTVLRVIENETAHFSS
jgi:YgiT-type zinc finger domain-containing protein